jgi:hypothetical protein
MQMDAHHEKRVLAGKREQLTFLSPLRRCFKQHPLTNAGERKVKYNVNRRVGSASQFTGSLLED